VNEPALACIAAAAGALAAPAFVTLAATSTGSASQRAIRLGRRMAAACDRILRPLHRAAAEGVLPGDRERLRLQAAAALVGFLVGTAIAGTLAGVAFAGAAIWAATRSLLWRRARYRRRVDAGSAAAALALADALAGGHSVRNALTVAGRGLIGPIGLELRRVGRELDLGAETEDVLERLRRRARSRRVDLIVAAIRIQRRSGGALATLLRGIAAAIEEQERLEDESRAASAQARFTSVIVLFLPLGGLLLGELASPGIVGRMTGSVVGMWLLGSALVLQCAGVVLIRRLSRVEV
jgi:tight adherence protein B